jgi:hypothetical protein
MVSVRPLLAAVWAGELESVTVNVSGVELIAVVGVPLITPDVRVKPAGSVPVVSLQV